MNEEQLDLRRRQMQRAWFDAQGVPAPPDAIHDDDDMYRPDIMRGEDARRRAEYMRSGHEALLVLEDVLDQAGQELSDCDAVLDFACGYGRLTRFLAAEIGPSHVWCCDVLEAAVDFASQRFGVHGFYGPVDPTALVFPRKFDLIWVGSLFSHLPRQRFEQFLVALAGALSPDGILAFSSHNVAYIPPDERDPSGLTFVPKSESHILESSEYGTTFVEERTVRDICASHGIELVSRRDFDLWRIHDVNIVGARPMPRMQPPRQTAVVRGAIETVRTTDGQVWIGGFARAPVAEVPLREVYLLVDGKHRFDMNTRPCPDDPPAREGGARFVQTDFYVEGPADQLEPGFHTLCGVARMAGGRACCFDTRSLTV